MLKIYIEKVMQYQIGGKLVGGVCDLEHLCVYFMPINALVDCYYVHQQLTHFPFFYYQKHLTDRLVVVAA